MTKTQRMLVLAHLTNDYHSGQWSRGYRLSCRVQRWWSKRFQHVKPCDVPLGTCNGELALYTALAAKYGNKL